MNRFRWATLVVAIMLAIASIVTKKDVNNVNEQNITTTHIADGLAPTPLAVNPAGIAVNALYLTSGQIDAPKLVEIRATRGGPQFTLQAAPASAKPYSDYNMYLIGADARPTKHRSPAEERRRELHRLMPFA